MNILNFFSYLYDKTILWSGHRHAPYYLAGVSLAESSFFPIPPDVMLISMGLARPKQSWRNALIATVFSVLGGIIGYLIGLYGMTLIKPYLMSSSYAEIYQQTVHWFEVRGLWVVILAGFTPFPYKICTITAGAMHLYFPMFVLGSIIGRGLRFFLVCSLLYFAGDKIELHIRRYVDVIGWSMLFVIAAVFLVIKVS
jgi:membrane protein YqaA with SNARE-associated domain